MTVSRSQFESTFFAAAKDLDITALDTASIKWWHDSRNSGGFRITLRAYEYLLSCQVDGYRFSIDAELLRKPKILLDLDRKINCPYYLQSKRPAELILFGSQDAVMLSLYNDIERFLQNTVPRSSQ